MRERRNTEKLESYFQEFQKTNSINLNVHPWIGESWQRSIQEGVTSGKPKSTKKLSSADLMQSKEKHHDIIEYIQELYDSFQTFLSNQKGMLLLTDSEGYILETYEGSYLNFSDYFKVGQRISEEDIGTSSLPIAYLHQTIFTVFAQELWQKSIQTGWMGTAPIVLGEAVEYGITLVSETDDSNDALVAVLGMIRTSVEQFLRFSDEVKAQRTVLNAVPLAIYRVGADSRILYANELGKQRLATISPQDQYPKLNEIVFNYERTPIAKAIQGVPTYSKDANWHTRYKTYNDITTAIPINRYGEVEEVVTVTMPIEDLRSLVAYVAGFNAKYTLDSLYGKSAALVQMKEKAEKVAKQRGAILLLGDKGTGKQRLAHGIHQASNRLEGPFISVKFGDSAPELLEMELFGRIDPQGDSQPGKFELADGGTLFLNTLEKIPPALSDKLLQVLSKGKVSRIGETTERVADVRIIGSSDLDLKKLADRGEFYEPLYQWLSRSVIRVPSLHNRMEDVPLLGAHILQELSQQNNLPPKKLTKGAIEVLKSYDWPGNIKQLQLVMEQAFFRTTSLTLEASDVLLPGANPKDQTWKEDRATFMELWDAAGGNVSRLSNMLSVSRVTLYRYMKKHGVVKE